MLTKISPKMQNLGQSGQTFFLLIAWSKLVPKSNDSNFKDTNFST